MSFWKIENMVQRHFYIFQMICTLRWIKGKSSLFIVWVILFWNYSIIKTQIKNVLWEGLSILLYWELLLGYIKVAHGPIQIKYAMDIDFVNSIAESYDSNSRAFFSIVYSQNWESRIHSQRCQKVQFIRNPTEGII